MMINSTHQPLPRGAIGFALGIAGMLVSLYYSIMFISGNATGIEVLIGVIFALTLDYGKVALASEAILALVQFRLISAVVYSLIVITLYCLSMLAATFMLTSHNTSAAAEQFDSRVASISQQVTAKRAELAACPVGIVTKCVNPRTAELTALQKQLSEAQNVTSDVIAAKNTAATWEKMARTLGTTPDELQVKLAFARAILLEIIAPIFVSIFLTAYRNRLPTAQPSQFERVIEQPAAPVQQVHAPEQPKPLPAMDMGKLAKN
jgi:hypothetical protein